MMRSQSVDMPVILDASGRLPGVGRPTRSPAGAIPIGSSVAPNACSLLTRTQAVQLIDVALTGVPGRNPQTCLYTAGPPTDNILFISVGCGSNPRVELPGSPVRNPTFIPVAVGRLTAYWYSIPEQELGLNSPLPQGGGDLTVVDKGELIRVSVEGAGTDQESTAVSAMKIIVPRI